MDQIARVMVKTASVLAVLRSLPNICFVALVGSISRGQPSDNIDFLVGVSVLDANRVEEISSALLGIPALASPPLLFDDALQFSLISNEILSLGLYETQGLIEKTNQYSEGLALIGEKRPWAVSAWFPESFCADLVGAKVLYDSRKVVHGIQANLNPYPEMLAKAIMLLSCQEIECKSSKLATAGPLEAILIAADLISCLTRAIFAKNRIYFPGFKDVAANLAAMNCQLAKRLSALYLTTQLGSELIKNIIDIAKEIRHETDDNTGS